MKREQFPITPGSNYTFESRTPNAFTRLIVTTHGGTEVEVAIAFGTAARVVAGNDIAGITLIVDSAEQQAAPGEPPLTH
jgi:hypothetical protein